MSACVSSDEIVIHEVYAIGLAYNISLNEKGTTFVAYEQCSIPQILHLRSRSRMAIIDLKNPKHGSYPAF